MRITGTRTLSDISSRTSLTARREGGRKPWVVTWRRLRMIIAGGIAAEADVGSKYAQHVGDIIGAAGKEGREIAVYRGDIAKRRRANCISAGLFEASPIGLCAAGGVCIATKCKSDFRTAGHTLLGFETQDVVPDIVVWASPIGNAFPLAAVITDAEIAASFAEWGWNFSAPWGQSGGVRGGVAVLDVLRGSGVPRECAARWQSFIEATAALQERNPLIGGVPRLRGYSWDRSGE